MKHRVLVADPPWKFGDKLPGPGRGAEKHYATLSVDELERFPLPPLADDAVLLLWRVASMQEEALRVARAWGFKVKSEIVWLKATVCKTCGGVGMELAPGPVQCSACDGSGCGKRWFGMGRQVRMEHEVCLIATRGRVAPKNRSTRSTFEAPAGRHSQKPERFFDLVEQLYEGPYCEMFARRVRTGWTCLGDEVPAQPAEVTG